MDDEPGDGDGTDPGSAGTERPNRAAATGVRLFTSLFSKPNVFGGLLDVTVYDAAQPRGAASDRSTVDECERERRQTGVRSSDKRGSSGNCGSNDQRSSSDGCSTRRVRVRASRSCLVDARCDGDEFVVMADIPGAEVDELTVGIDSRTDQLVIGRDEAVVGRVDPPWRSVELKTAWFNNGVLEVRMRTAGS